MDLFAHEPVFIRWPDAEMIFYPSFFTPDEAGAYFDILRKQTEWRQDEIVLYGKRMPVPRLQAWYGDEKNYQYSGIPMRPRPWTRPLREIKDRIEQVAGHEFTNILLNLYRHGRDSVAWHADDEPELGPRPVIASVSLGHPRPIAFRHNSLPIRKKILLPHGSLLIMKGTTQHYWQHQIPKTAKKTGERINLTFRKIF